MDQLSDPSTACSSPTVDSVEKVIKNDAVRYIRKGYGLFSAIAITIAFFYGFPIVFKELLSFMHLYLTTNQEFLLLTVGLHTAIAVIANSVFYFIYVSKIPFFERYRVLTTPWPWESDPEKWKLVLKKTSKTLFINHVIIIPLLSLNEIWQGVKLRFDLESYPGYQEMIFQTVFFMICEDFTFYWCHRLLHHPKLYPYIHKKHHEYGITISIAAEYAHPIEFIFGNIVRIIFMSLTISYQ